MAGQKGKSGLSKGRTNNPNGRPVGSKNKISSPIKKKIEEFVDGDWDNLKRDIASLDTKDSVKARIDLIKLIVPRPISDEEKEGVNKLYGGLAHLFGHKQDTVEE